MEAMNKSVLLGWLVVFLVSLSFIPQVMAVICGDTLTENTTLNSNLVNCPGTGLTIGADNIVLDCDGYSINGSSGNFGIYASGRNGFTVRNCDVSGFVDSLYITNSDNNIIENNIFNDYVVLMPFGGNSDHNIIRNNEIRDMGQVYGSFNIFDNNNFTVDPGYSGNVINLQGPNNTISSNNFTGINKGRAVFNSNEAIGNNISNNIISNYYLGIELGASLGGQGAQANILYNNSFVDNFYAVEIWGGDLNLVYGNMIASVGSTLSNSNSAPSRPYIDLEGNPVATQNEGWGFVLGDSNFNIMWNNSIYNQNNEWENNSNFYCYQGDGNEYNFNITPDCVGDCIIPNCTVILDTGEEGSLNSLRWGDSRSPPTNWSGWMEFYYPDAFDGDLQASTPGTGSDRTGWTVHTKPSQYEVIVWKFDHPYTPLMGTNVHYYVKHVNGINLFTIDWTTTGNEWISLGNFTFDDIGGLQGVMINDNANGYVIADAIKVISNGPPVYEEGISNNIKVADDSGLSCKPDDFGKNYLTFK